MNTNIKIENKATIKRIFESTLTHRV